MKRFKHGEHYLIFYGGRERIGIYDKRNDLNNQPEFKIIEKTPSPPNEELHILGSTFSYPSCCVVKRIPLHMLIVEKMRIESGGTK